MNLFKDGFERCGFLELRVIIFIVDIVPHTDKLTPLVRTGQQNDRHAHCILWGDFGCVGGLSLKYKFVSASGYWSHQDRVQNLVIRLVRGRAHVDYIPLQVYRKQGDDYNS